MLSLQRFIFSSIIFFLFYQIQIVSYCYYFLVHKDHRQVLSSNAGKDSIIFFAEIRRVPITSNKGQQRPTKVNKFRRVPTKSRNSGSPGTLLGSGSPVLKAMPSRGKTDAYPCRLGWAWLFPRLGMFFGSENQ